MVGLFPKDLHGGNSANPSDGWSVSKRPPIEVTAPTRAMVGLFPKTSMEATAPTPAMVGLFPKTFLEATAPTPAMVSLFQREPLSGKQCQPQQWLVCFTEDLPGGSSINSINLSDVPPVFKDLLFEATAIQAKFACLLPIHDRDLSFNKHTALSLLQLITQHTK
jgi:hypothetical protein